MFTVYKDKDKYYLRKSMCRTKTPREIIVSDELMDNNDHAWTLDEIKIMMYDIAVELKDRNLNKTNDELSDTMMNLMRIWNYITDKE